MRARVREGELGIARSDYSQEVGLDSQGWQTREIPSRIKEGKY